MHSLKEEFAQVTAAAPISFRHLTLIPLLRPEPSAEPDYLLAEDAIQSGVARITELPNGGSVPELQFENKSSKPVLLLDGEELIGAKQNRTLNLTILAPPQSVTVIPVSCVEAGRWHPESDAFRSAPHFMYSKARARKAQQVTECMSFMGARRSDQAEVWNEIAGKGSRMNASSPTQAMAAVYESHSSSTEEYVRAFECLPRQAGVIFAISGKTTGLDLFDHPQTFRRVFPKLLRSYALDAIETPSDAAPAAVTAEAILSLIAEATTFAQPAVGEGKDIRVTGPSVSGGALWAGDRYIHVCAFSLPHHENRPLQTRISRPSRRRQS